MKKRNISGLFIRVKSPGSSKYEKRCIEDNDTQTIHMWLELQDRKTIVSVALNLCQTIKELGEVFNIIRE